MHPRIYLATLVGDDVIEICVEGVPGTLAGFDVSDFHHFPPFLDQLLLPGLF